MTLILGYWNIRSFVEPSRLLLHYTKTSFTNKVYRSSDEWLKDKHSLGLDFPNLPYLIDGHFKINSSKNNFNTSWS